MRKKERAVVPCSHAEYEALPEQLRKKYFSSLERLRIAEQHALHEQTQYSSSRRSSHAPAPSIGIRRSLTVGSSRRRLRKAESLRKDHAVAAADAQFFLSLPEKVQRSAFSREEQVLLVGRCDHAPAFQLPRPSLRQDNRLDDFQFDFYNDDDSDSTEARGRTRRRSSSPHSDASISPTRTSPSHIRQDSDSSLFFLDIMGPPSTVQQSTTSFRRTMSLSSMPLRHSTSSAPVVTETPLSARTTSAWHQRAQSQSVSGRRSSHTPTAPVFDPEATHYRDPAARKKLRMYLASPQKFDEAVEFGFPSTSGDEGMPARYQLPPITTDARNFSRDMQTFLRDDKVSYIEEKEDENKGLESDGDSLADMDSPVTPSSIGLSFRYHTRHQSSNFSSMDSTGLPPIHPMSGRLNREMTLRMTLTRPDLRADEDQLYGWQGQKGPRDDPFALEELHLSDDMNGTKGPFYVKPKAQGNLVSRLFKRASKRGR